MGVLTNPANIKSSPDGEETVKVTDLGIDPKLNPLTPPKSSPLIRVIEFPVTCAKTDELPISPESELNWASFIK